MSSNLSAYCSGPSPSSADTEIKPELQNLIHNLILYIHEKEPDIEKSILVFLPTYYSLEQQWYQLEPFRASFEVHILHRSIDTEQALAAMKICRSRRKVILATNIAESSVTIPKVAYVIDSCRSLQVFWDASRKRDAVQLVWVSRSQAEQRRGRTGRTCDGEVYRLVPSGFFNKLEEHEPPAILKLSLRQQVLHICCTESRAINDANVLTKAMDPPNTEVIDDALSMLLSIRALRKSPRGRYEPTFYGRLLASFPLSFDASILVVKFGEMGMLREGILLGVLMDTQPLPINHPFGDDSLFLEYVDHYFAGNGSKTISAGRREVVLMANLCAFQFWQRVFKDKHRLENLKQLLSGEIDKDLKLMLPEIEQEWCNFHNIVRSSFYHVSEMYEDTLSKFHRFRPQFISSSNSLPTYYSPYEFDHTCYVECQTSEDRHPHSEDEVNNQPHEVKKCVSVPFVPPNAFQANAVAKNMANIIKEIRTQCTPSDDGHGAIEPEDYSYAEDRDVQVCVYFLNGSCNRGDQCTFSHTLQSTRPACKFFASLQGCRNGESCLFSHVMRRRTTLYCPPPCLPEEDDSSTSPLLDMFPTSSEGCILVLDDSDMHFTSRIANRYPSWRILSTSSSSETLFCDSSLADTRIFWGLNHPYETIISKAGEENPIPWNEVKCVLWFLNPDSYAETPERQKTILQNFFEYMAIRILGDKLYEIRVILTMNNVRFSDLQVEKIGRDGFFFLGESFPHNSTSFGEFPDTFSNQKPMQVSRPTSYVFDLHPPTDIQFGDYTSILHKALHNK